MLKIGSRFFQAVFLLHLSVTFGITFTSCFSPEKESSTSNKKGTYGFDATFLQEHLHEITELKNEDGASVLVTGDYQGRVMTSTATGDTGNSFGWINYPLIEKGEKLRQFNPVGGEERLWIGPEGGQFGFYFDKDASFDFENWRVPPFIDTEAFQIKSSDKSHVAYTHETSLENYAGERFDLEISRTVSLLNRSDLEDKLEGEIPASIKWVGYQTTNELKNKGSNAWSQQKGQPSIWLLGMFTPSEETVAIIPFHKTTDYQSHITDSYFGSIPADRLSIVDSVLLLKCDGKHRSKLGLSPQITKPIAGSFDFKKNVLTLILFPVDPAGHYVNSKWEFQKNPFQGDAVNAYNDGPLADGTQMGPFYELESSSQALSLKPGESHTYQQVTCHFEGDFLSLNELAIRWLGIDLKSVRLH
jgi:hypothetical protein